MAEDYTPPKVWQWQPGGKGLFATIDRPIAGATQQRRHECAHARSAFFPLPFRARSV